MNNDVYYLWEEFASTGSFGPPHNGYFVNGAAPGMVTLGPYLTKEVTIVLGWYFPDRDFLVLHVGNFYDHLFKSSAEAAGKRGGDVVLRHNQLRDVFVDICHKANLGMRIEAGSALTPDLSRSRFVDALVNNWIGGSSAAFDVTVTSPLTPVSLQESSVTAGTAALLAEQRKHQANDPKCDTLGWKCIPLAVESYGNWGFEARQAFSHLASRLSFGIGHQKSKLLVDIYGRLNVTLVRCNARALLSRACNLF
ncbi:hypothetical protein EMCRGX_G021496 [Ephydatia muelleri]